MLVDVFLKLDSAMYVAKKKDDRGGQCILRSPVYKYIDTTCRCPILPP